MLGAVLILGMLGCGGVEGGRMDPSARAAAWDPLVGEYVRDGTVALLLERADTLFLRTDPAHEVAVRPAGGDTVRAVADPAWWVVERDARGAVVGLAAPDGTWRRRDPGQAVFRIVPRRPVGTLLRAARWAVPPAAERPDLLPADLVDVQALDTTLRLDVRYAGTDNFLGEPVYASSRAYLQRPAAEALVRVHRALAAAGYGLLIHDAYRPWHVTWVFWEATADSLRRFVADPAQGSRHNRGAAVDLTLFEMATGRPVTMPSGYDEFSPRAHPDYPGGTSRQREHRDLLQHAMEAEGFAVYEYEWWHFDFTGWEQYPILNVPLEELELHAAG